MGHHCAHHKATALHRPEPAWVGGAQGSSGGCGSDVLPQGGPWEPEDQVHSADTSRVCTAGRGAAGCLWEARGQPPPVLARGAQTPAGRGAAPGYGGSQG